MTDTELFEVALRATKLAYVPYSGFHVGAALLCADGTVYTGANIENASYGATVCAERTALFQAVLQGKRDFVKLAVAAKNKDGAIVPAAPCGVCRQTLSEFSDGSLQVLFGTKQNLTRTTLAELLAYAFSF